MYEEGLKGLVTISQALGNYPEFVQGGGGNTSAKLGDGFMAIKASGYLIKEITEEIGFVAVNYETIMDYYQNGDHTRDVDYDKESQTLAIDSIKQIKSEPARRPSVEVGFHSALKRYVMHSHSVYANCFMCAEEGDEKLKALMDTTGLDYVILPFINPGYPLSLQMIRMLDERKAQGLNTDVIFLQNHGLIVTSDDADLCVALNTRVNNLMKEALQLKDFGAPAVKQVAEGIYQSDTPWLKALLKADAELAAKIEQFPLYPDQLVYVNGMSLEDDQAKIHIDAANGVISYRGGEGEALAIEETLAGVAYVISSVIAAGMTVRPMPEEGIRYILGWESEKYRRSMVNSK